MQCCLILPSLWMRWPPCSVEIWRRYVRRTLFQPCKPVHTTTNDDLRATLNGHKTGPVNVTVREADIRQIRVANSSGCKLDLSYTKTYCSSEPVLLEMWSRSWTSPVVRRPWEFETRSSATAEKSVHLTSLCRTVQKAFRYGELSRRGSWCDRRSLKTYYNCLRSIGARVAH